MRRAGRWDEEKHAAEVLVAMLGGEAAVRDPGGGAVAAHDFDLRLDNGQLIAVEVTRHNFEAELRQQPEVTARGDRRFRDLRNDWHLGMIRRFDVKRVVAEAPALLVAFEQRGIESARLMQGSEDPTLSALWSLGVRRFYRLGEASEGGGKLDIGSAPVTGSTAPEVLTEVVEEMARRRGKAAKLLAAAADERHLFIWVESSRDNVIAAMGLGAAPDAPPNLLAAIDVVWLATGYEYPHVWRYDRGSGWTDWCTPTRGPGSG